MMSINKMSVALLAGAMAVAGFAADASAHKRAYHHRHSAPTCHARMEGRATGQGLFGLGSEKARAAAVSEWQARVGARWGERYTNFNRARGVHFDCAKGALLKAKCVVTAMPCL